MESIYISRFENKLFNFKRYDSGHYAIRNLLQTPEGLQESKWERVDVETFNFMKNECVEKVERC